MTLTPQFLDELRARTLAVGADRQDHQAHKAGREYTRLLPVPQREDAQLLRQRRQGLLPLLRLLGAWRRDPLDDRPARAAVHGCGEGTRRRPPGMDMPAMDRAPPRRPSAPRACTRSMADAATWFTEQLDGLAGARGARAARPARDQAGDRARVRHRLRARLRAAS